MEVATQVRHEGAVTSATYRPDIDGLRAIAVLSVIGFHARLPFVPGGFIGVDVFFVISGYLISGIILRSLRQGTFSFATFYVRRIKRIFPALILVLIASMAIGWVALLGDEYERLGKHVASAAAFASNFTLWKESGYFDVAADSKPLLHLWSLGVEEQFYLLWPLLVVFAWKPRWRLFTVVVTVALASFFLNVVTVGVDPAAAFYLPHTRLWELLIGALLACFTVEAQADASWSPRLTPLVRDLTSLAGALLLLAGLFILGRSRTFPGWWALPPTVGTFLLIAGGPTAWINRTVLSNRLLVWVGLISYPLYLWHWPLLSFASIIKSGVPTAGSTAAALALAFVLAAATFRVVERPIRAATVENRGRFISLSIFGITAVGLAGLLVLRGTVAPLLASSYKIIYTARRADAEIRAQYPTSDCSGIKGLGPLARKFCSSYGDPSSGNLVVVWGDSHAGAWSPVFLDIAKTRHAKVVLFIVPGCPPLVGVRRTDIGSADNCRTFGVGEDIAAAIVALHPQHVFMVARWSIYSNGQLVNGVLDAGTHFLTTHERGEATIQTSREALESQFKKTLLQLNPATSITIFKTMPTLKTSVYNGLVRNPTGVEPRTIDHVAFEALPSRLIDEAAAAINGVDILDPSQLSCQESCRAIVSNILLYTDDNHVSAPGSLLYRELVSARF